MGINKYMYRVCMGVNDLTGFCKGNYKAELFTYERIQFKREL